jgi:hypothetical protein
VPRRRRTSFSAPVSGSRRRYGGKKQIRKARISHMADVHQALYSRGFERSAKRIGGLARRVHGTRTSGRQFYQFHPGQGAFPGWRGM